MAIETIDYFLRNNSEVFICSMDMTKAFDNVKHSKLFQRLLHRDFPSIMIRFLMCTRFKWLMSDGITVTLWNLT